jgi:hypothetical protein
VVNFEETAMSKDRIIAQLRVVNDVMTTVMKDGEHYGIIPGCGKKPSLLKPGAEKLSLTFRLAPRYEINKSDLGNGHREYEITCNLYHIPTNQFVGQGVGACSTMEGKFRYRVGITELTGQMVPKEYWKERDLKLIGGKGHTTQKNDAGQWEIAIQGEKVEHDNPADYYNTVLKMAKKRAHVDAILTATGASDIFTQDVEDMPEVIPQPLKPEPKTEIKQPQEKQDTLAEKSDNKSETSKAISDAQRKRLYAIYKGAGKTDEQVKGYLFDIYGITTSKEITKENYEAICKWAEMKMDSNMILCPELNYEVTKVDCQNCLSDNTKCEPYQEYLTSRA